MLIAVAPANCDNLALRRKMTPDAPKRDDIALDILIAGRVKRWRVALYELDAISMQRRGKSFCNFLSQVWQNVGVKFVLARSPLPIELLHLPKLITTNIRDFLDRTFINQLSKQYPFCGAWYGLTANAALTYLYLPFPTQHELGWVRLSSKLFSPTQTY